MFLSTNLEQISQAMQSIILSDIDITLAYNKKEVEVANYKGPYIFSQWREVFMNVLLSGKL